MADIYIISSFNFSVASSFNFSTLQNIENSQLSHRTTLLNCLKKHIDLRVNNKMLQPSFHIIFRFQQHFTTTSRLI